MPALATAPASITYGTELTFETLSMSALPADRSHDEHATFLRVIAGIVRCTTEESECLLGPGQEAIVPAGVTHQLASVVGESRIVRRLH